MQYSVYGAGSNSHHQLAHPADHDLVHFAQLPFPSAALAPLDIVAGASHSLLLAEDEAAQQTVYGAGSSSRGQLPPLSSTSSLRTSFTPLSLDELLGPLSFDTNRYTPIAVAACWETSFILLRPSSPFSSSSSSYAAGSDVLISLGANDWGERGLGSPSLTPLEATIVRFNHLFQAGEEVVQVEKIKAGPRHVLALLSIYASSSAPSTSTTPPARKVLVGWGASRHGQLGSSSPSSGKPPRSTVVPSPVTLPYDYASSDIVDFACGKDHSAILLRVLDGESRLVLLGLSKHGQLGPVVLSPPSGEQDKGEGKAPAPSSNVLSAFELLGAAAACGPLPPLSHKRTEYAISAISCTWNGTYAILSPSSRHTSPSSPTLEPVSCSSPPSPDILLSFGLNSHGQLGSSSPLSHSSLTSAPSSASTSSTGAAPPPDRPQIVQLSPSFPALLRSADFPPSPPYPAAPPSGQTRIVKLACGSEHVLALLSFSSLSPTQADEAVERREVWGWGWNEHGNLGSSLASPSDPAYPPGEGESETTSEAVGAELEDVWVPRRVWPPLAEEEEKGGTVEDVWAGMATSWVGVRGA
ncbi:hypothetical protein JCM8547_004964 [Rhodosporidiobolus lusitaniae]